MTDRIRGLTVTLDQDYREDDVQAIVSAISMVRGVAHVALHVADIDAHMARARVRHEVAERLVGLAQEIVKGEP